MQNISSRHQEIIELRFPLLGKVIPSQHGYETFAAICREIPEVHGCHWIGIHTIQGRLIKPGFIRIEDSSSLRLRLPVDKLSVVYKLAGKILEIGGCRTRCTIPTVHVLEPYPQLRSRIVLIKIAGKSPPNLCEASPFLSAVKRKLKSMEVEADVILEPSNGNKYGDPYARRVLKIKGATVPGYGVILSNLSEEDSLKVQAVGIGGRRHMGCGLFEPISTVDNLCCDAS